MPTKNNAVKKSLTPVKAIRAKCLDCCYDQPSEVKLCPCGDCPLYSYRLGKNPNCVKVLGEKERAAVGDRLRASRRQP